jgi:hypothetical protein
LLPFPEAIEASQGELSDGGRRATIRYHRPLYIRSRVRVGRSSIVTRLQPRVISSYHLRARAPTAPLIAITISVAIVYQIATNSGESSKQFNA